MFEALVVGLLVAVNIGTYMAAEETKKQLERIDRRMSRQTEILIALLAKNGINPVTLD